MKTRSTSLAFLAIASLAFTGCSASNHAQAPDATSSSSSSDSFTWEADPYPTDAPSLLSKETPGSGWYKHSPNFKGATVAGEKYTVENFDQWQTIYSYSDANAGPGATVAVVFRDPATCHKDMIENNVALSLIDENFYGYLDQGPGHTYPKQDGENGVGGNYEQGRADYTGEVNSDSPVFFANKTANDGTTDVAGSLSEPGRSSGYYITVAKDSSGQEVYTSCSTVFTALTKEGAQTYDAAKFKQAYQQADQFAQKISAHKVPA